MSALPAMRTKFMSHAIHPSLTSPPIANHLDAGDSQRLPVPQALAVIAVLASSLWLGIGAIVLWLAGWWPLIPG